MAILLLGINERKFSMKVLAVGGWRRQLRDFSMTSSISTKWWISNSPSESSESDLRDMYFGPIFFEAMYKQVKKEIKKHLSKLIPVHADKRVERRIRKFSSMGVVNS